MKQMLNFDIENEFEGTILAIFEDLIVNLQNTAIFLKAIHFSDEIKLIFFQQARDSMT